MAQRSSDARKRIVQAALALFAARGYHSAGIADILKESGVNRATLYHYFPTKKELGFAAIDEQLRLLVEQGAARHLRTDGHPIDSMLEMIDELPGLVRLETGEALTPSLAARLGAVDADFQERLAAAYGALIDELEVILRRGVAQGQIADSVDPRVLTHVFTVMCEGIQFTSVLGLREAILEDGRRWLREYVNSLRA
jgi:TetR/AcrR family transcriptional repressor of nem operon